MTTRPGERTRFVLFTGMAQPHVVTHFVNHGDVTALIKLKGGATINLDAMWACHTGNPNMNVELFGTEAGATLYPAEVYRFSDIAEYDVVKDVKADITYKECCRFANFTNAVLGKEEVCTKVEQSLAVQRILDGIYESSKTGHEVRLAPAPGNCP